MFDDFFVRALVAATGVAVVAGPLGCLVVWRKMAYFGATLSHSALLGVALGLLLGVDPMIGVAAQCLLVVPALVLLERVSPLSTDSQLGILAHATLAIGLIIFGFMTWVRVDLTGYLFGDILAVSQREIVYIYVGGAIILTVLAMIWRPLLAGTVNSEIAAAEGMQPERTRIIFMFLVAATIAIGMKVAGVLLILSFLIIPPAAARAMARSPEQMAAGSIIVGVAATLLGLGASNQWDTPSGPSIVVAALAIFLASLLPWRRLMPRPASERAEAK
ncbi:MAG: metal ABC transporter permease [Alphaproteobacteria bacterium]|nr:metal ABC transporter permease [Alphaproteobacteria bacterium]